LVRRDALIDQFPGFALDVKRELVVQITLDSIGGDHRANAESQVAKAH
jgi:hypothetical protein